MNPSLKQIAIESVSDSFQIWDLNQYSHARNIFEIVFVIGVKAFPIYFQMKQGCCISHDKQTKSSDFGLLRPSFIYYFLARVSLPNWYVLVYPALDDLVEF